MKKAFSKSWKASSQPRKQRKYVFNAPKHIKQNLLGAHLSSQLRKKFGKRSAVVRKGDAVVIKVGGFRNRSGKVERVDIKGLRVYIAGIDSKKKDGTKVFIPVKASNLVITELADDKKRTGKW